MFKGRNHNDHLHFYGSGGMSFVLLIIYILITRNIWLSYALAVLTTNMCGWLYEFLEWKILPSFNDPWFKDKPDWITGTISGDGRWDWVDVYLNFLGSLIIISVLCAVDVININVRDKSR